MHPQDVQHFAFTLPSINRQAPAERYEWTVLPQGMKNSPTLCQLYVAEALQPLRRQWTDVIIYHYMDDILFCQKDNFSIQQQEYIRHHLQQFGLIVAPEKCQSSTPWKYLGWTLTSRSIRPQKLQFNTRIATLHDTQTLLGDLQWLRPFACISNDDLQVFCPLLKGTDPAAPVVITSQQQLKLNELCQRITDALTARLEPLYPVDLLCLLDKLHHLAALI